MDSPEPQKEPDSAARLFQAEVSEIAWTLGRDHPLFDRLMAAVTRHNRTLPPKARGVRAGAASSVLDADDLESIRLALAQFPTWFPETIAKIDRLR